MKSIHVSTFHEVALMVCASYIISMGLIMTEQADYGLILFFGAPLVPAIYAGRHLPFGRGLLALLLGHILACGFLIFINVEGIICVVLASPLVLVVFIAGYFLGRWVQNYIKPRNNITSTIIPLLILAGLLFIEHESYNRLTRNGKEVTVVALPYSADKVFNQVISIDEIIAKPSMPFYLGLPLPEKCVMRVEGDTIYRTCVFNQGTIDEIVTEMIPDKVLHMEVIASNLKGRHWLEFLDARYDFTENPGGTLIRRTTSYKSTLRPRWYWEPLERWGIRTEHEFIFEDLELRLERK